MINILWLTATAVASGTKEKCMDIRIKVFWDEKYHMQ